ncbi:hypothetical protein K9U40_00450 [Xanthobacter autotrophicus]|uniref:hypothetical protein n=1 Tax=Xanthobacter TaxID=279 RepID=UPI0024AB518B|nr:hypothetical protein [Xanthobacter autotrophicus]MDI4662814.1 hypothetical protein [Xanthobacter autotrophicus]
MGLPAHDHPRIAAWLVHAGGWSRAIFTRPMPGPRPPARYSFARLSLARLSLARLSLARLVLAWTLAYLVLAQGMVGAFAAGAMAAPTEAGAVLCIGAAHDTADTDDGPAQGVVRSLHCFLCPAAGSVPLLAVPPRLPLPAAPLQVAASALRGHLAAPLLPAREQARPRAPPAAA